MDELLLTRNSWGWTSFTSITRTQILTIYLLYIFIALTVFSLYPIDGERSPLYRGVTGNPRGWKALRGVQVTTHRHQRGNISWKARLSQDLPCRKLKSQNPFLSHLHQSGKRAEELKVVRGKSSFGRQIGDLRKQKRGLAFLWEEKEERVFD